MPRKTQNKYLSKWLTWAIAAAMLVVIVFGYIALRNITRIRDGEAQVAASHAVREVANKLLSSVKDLETGQRGLLLTNDPTYLEPYHTGLNNLAEEFVQLKRLANISKTQQERIKKIGDLVDQKKTDIAETIAKHSEFIKANLPDDTVAAKNEAINIVLSGRGKTVMDNLHSVVRELLAEEADQLKVREEDSEARAATSKLSVLAGNLLALSLLAISGVVATQDRKERDHAMAELESKQRELEGVFNTSPDGIVTFDHDLHIRMINPTAARVYQCDPRSVFGQPLLQFVAERVRADVGEGIRDFIQSNEQLRRFENGFGIRSDGSEFPCQGSLLKMSGQPYFTRRFQDLSQEKLAAEQIQEQTEILAQVRDAIFVCDSNDQITFWNRGANRLFGFSEEEAIGNNAVELLFINQPDEWNAAKPELAEHGVVADDFMFVNQQGEELFIEQRRSLIRNRQREIVAQLVISADVTDRKRQEAKERRAQRIESIGTLTGGIAHDLNNLLTPILMNAKLLKRGRGDSVKLADNIVLSAQRGSDLIAKLLSFAGGNRDSQQVREPIDVGAILDEAKEILQHVLTQSVDLQVECVPPLHPIIGDPTELSQVIMNLAINARDAMPDGGRLEIKAESFVVDEQRAKRNNNLKPGEHVLITVADEGTGIPKNVIEKIFDPFFTTKAQGKGTGLGLATSLGIVRYHGGDMSVDSEVGKGTSFSILLPSLAVLHSEIQTGIIGSIPSGNGATILLVDDENMILEAARAILEDNGYQVKTATNGSAAISLLQHSDQDQVDLIVLDMMMPGLDGIQTRDGIRAFNHAVPIIASSGLRRLSQQNSQALNDFEAFLPKPYTDEQLLRAVGSVLKKSDIT